MLLANQIQNNKEQDKHSKSKKNYQPVGTSQSHMEMPRQQEFFTTVQI